MTAVLEDNQGPIITEVFPEIGNVVRNNRQTVSANIVDAETGVDSIAIIFDNQLQANFEYDEESGDFSYTPANALSEGEHSFLLRAYDLADNVSDATVRFVVNSTAGVISVDATPTHTINSRFNFAGNAEPLLMMQLVREGEVVSETQASLQGRFRFSLVPLDEFWNVFEFTGRDNSGNVATPATDSIYVDIQPPVIEILSPEELTAEPRPEVLALIDEPGVGVDEENGLDLSIDGTVINDFNYDQGVLSYDVPEDLEEGVHNLSANAVDLLGNSPDAPVGRTFFVDSRAPYLSLEGVEGQNLLDERIDSLGHREHEFTIPITDPLPSSGIDWDNVVLTLDDEELEHSVRESAILVILHGEDIPDEGVHELVFAVSDFAGNELRVEGQFWIGDIEDLVAPFIENIYPNEGMFVGLPQDEGRGARLIPPAGVADELRFTIGDNDAGVNSNSVGFSLNGQEYRQQDLRRAPGGRYSAPLWYAIGEEGRRQMPAEMPGLQEGINFANAFGADEDGNEGAREWQFFFDGSVPSDPSLNEPESSFSNVAEISVSGSTAGDEPDQLEGYVDSCTVFIYRNDERVAQVEGNFRSDFDVEGVMLVEGANVIRATAMDMGGNESDYSEPIEIFLDITVPTIEDFTIAGHRRFIADATPTLSATLLDEGSGIDPAALAIMVDDQEVEVQFDEEEGVVTGTVAADLEDGDHTATLTVADLAGNEEVAEWAFNVDTRQIFPPEFELEPYTSVNRVVLSGTGVQGQTVVLYLNNNLIDLLRLEESADFSFNYTADNLTDTSRVQMTSLSEAGIESERSETQLLVRDAGLPVISEFVPANGLSIESHLIEEISCLVSDAITGVDPESFTLTMRNEALQFSVEEEQGGYRLTADVRDIEFEDNEAVTVIATARDRSIPANPKRQDWQFVSIIGDPPTIAFPDTTIAEDDEMQVFLRDDFIHDPDNGWAELTVTPTLLEGEDNADVRIDQYGFLTITPAEDWFGRLVLRLHIEDVTGLEDADTTIVVITPVNDAPVIAAIRDTSAIVGREFTLQVAATDVDPDDELVFSDNFDHFDISADGLVRFTPTVDMTGNFGIRIAVSDGNGGRDQTDFHLFIHEVNGEIELAEGGLPDVEIDEDAMPLELTDLDDIFSDPDGTILGFEVSYDEAGISIEIDSDTHIPTLRPARDFFGDVVVTITAEDHAGSVISDNFTVTVVSFNDAPRIVGLLPQRVTRDEDAAEFVIVDLDSVFADVEGDQIFYSADGIDELGIRLAQDNILSIQPEADWNGVEVIRVTADDRGEGRDRRGPRRVEENGIDMLQASLTNLGSLQSSTFDPWAGRGPGRDASLTRDITVEVRPMNDEPDILVDDPYLIEMDEDQIDPEIFPNTLAEMFTDIDAGDQVVVSWEDLDLPVDLSLTNDRRSLMATIVEEHYFGEFDYPITATDRSGEDNVLTVHFTIISDNDAPEVVRPINDIVVVEDIDRPWFIADLDEVFDDVEDDALVFDVEAPAPLDAVIDGNNILTITAPDNFNGAGFDIRVTADDQQGRVAFVHFRGLRAVDAEAVHDAGPVRSLRSTGETAMNRIFTETFVPGRGRQPSRDDVTPEDFLFTITPANDIPFWVSVDGDTTVNETETVQFDLVADDVDLTREGDVLTLRMVNNGGTGGQFVDQGNGQGHFDWQTDNEDAGVYSPVFEVRDRAGRISRISVVVTVGDINRAPTVQNPIANQPFDEDAAERQIAVLSQVFNDADRDAMVYRIVGQVAGFNARIDAQNRLFLRPVANFNGPSQAIIEANDQRDSTVTDTFDIAVRSINDLPTAFILSSPGDTTHVWTMPNVRFNWRRSIDTVEDSVMTYSLVLLFNGTRHYYPANDTTLAIPRDALVGLNPNIENRIVWWVNAKDGIDSVRSSATWTVFVEPLSVDDDDLVVPTEVALGPVYPNPFNDRVTISYALPKAGMVALTVHDQNGRTIRMLVSRPMSVGRYNIGWDGLSESGSRAPSGLYIARLVTPSGVRMERLVLLR